MTDTGRTPSPTVAQINDLLGVNLWAVRSFRAEVSIDFDEFGNVLAVRLLNPDVTAPARVLPTTTKEGSDD